MIFKRTIPLLIVFGIGVLAFVQDYVPHPWSTAFRDEMTTWTMVIGGFAMFLGLYSLSHMHVTRIRRQMPGWGYSIFVFIGAIGMIAAGIFSDIFGPLAAGTKNEVDLFDWGYDNILIPCSATVFSILAFYMASAAFRTFRARNLAAGLLLAAAIIVMFGRVPVSEVVSGWLFNDRMVIPNLSKAIMDYPNLAAKRGIMLGIALGVISQSMRILLGIERSYMGGGDR
jgi:hypothetical protein